MKKTFVKGLALAVLGTALAAGSAWATPTLQISATGGSTITIADGQTGTYADQAAASGIVSWSGALGNFDFTVTSGSTKDAIGSGAVPKMHVTGSATASSTAGGTFTVAFSETGFGPMSPSLQGFLTAMGGYGGTATSLKAYYDTSDQLFGTDTSGTAVQIADLSSYGAQQVFNGIPSANPFSLTMVSTFTLGKADAASFDNGLKPVPEPATMLLLGSGLLGLAGVGRKKMKKA